MKKILTLFLMTFMSLSYALSVEEAYNEFYDNEIIDFNHCGRNIHHFLNYLDEKQVPYNQGQVISVHDDFGMLNHFDARWGSKELYADGESYLRSNYYFHVFLLIDGYAYDFSQRYTENQKALDYLEKVYLPKKKTENIFFQGVVTPEKMLMNHYNTKMRVHSTEEYRKNFKGNIYEGSFIELFEYYKGRQAIFEEKSLGHYKLSYSNKEETKWGMKFEYPSVIIENKETKLMAYGKNICNAYGFFGAHPGKTIHEVSDELEIFKIYSFLKPNLEAELNSSDFRISFKEMKTVGGISNQPLLHYAKSVTCTNLVSVLITQ